MHINQLNIKTKLIGINLVIILFTLIVGVTLITVNVIRILKNEIVNNTQVIAQVVGNNVIGDLAFPDPKFAQDTLKKLVTIPAIKNAIIYDASDKPFAQYDFSAASHMPPPPHTEQKIVFVSSFLTLFQTIRYQGMKIGTVYLRVSTDELNSTINKYLLIMALICIGLLVLATLMALKLQGIISEPILTLGTIAQRISREANYSIRVQKRSNDEIGQLYDWFNIMLEQIHKRALERDRVEEELHQAQLFLSKVIESMPSLLIVIAPDGIVTHWNSVAVKMTGIATDQAIGQSLWELTHLLDAYRDHVSEVQQTLKPLEIYRDRVQVNDDMFFMNILFFPLISDHVTGVVIRADNVTELEKKEMQLRQAQKMETVGTLAGGLAHDFNNILGGIIGTISLLRHKLKTVGTLPDTEWLHSMTVIDESANRAADMVRQVLALSRKQELTFSPVDLNTVIAHVQNICQNSFDKSIELKVVNTYEKAMVQADSTQMEQVLLNLCVNASHAMTIMRKSGEHWGGCLTIGLDREYSSREFCSRHSEARIGAYYWKLEVCDEGVGIEPRILTKVFDPFFSTKSKEVGTGLGLAIVYNIVQQHHGFVDLYSEHSIGTAFKIYLPELVAQGTLGDNAIADDELLCGQGLILVIDDEALIRDVAKEALETCGYQVIMAEDGVSGVALFRQRYLEIKLVLLDLIMPKKSGLDVFVELKAINPDVRVVMASGFRRDERVEDALALGVNDFIQKPYTLHQLTKVINRVINS